jgi:hypothetical protein
MIGTNIHPQTPKTTRVYTCNELGLCQMRTPRCEGCTVTHVYPRPGKLRFAPGALDFGDRRSRLEWLTSRRAQSAWELIRNLLICFAAVAVLAFIGGYASGTLQRYMALLGL